MTQQEDQDTKFRKTGCNQCGSILGEGNVVHLECGTMSFTGQLCPKHEKDMRAHFDTLSKR
jgi:hypothetical protein